MPIAAMESVYDKSYSEIKSSLFVLAAGNDGNIERIIINLIEFENDKAITEMLEDKTADWLNEQVLNSIVKYVGSIPLPKPGHAVLRKSQNHSKEYLQKIFEMFKARLDKKKNQPAAAPCHFCPMLHSPVVMFYFTKQSQ